jgi:hypothetical protein
MASFDYYASRMRKTLRLLDTNVAQDWHTTQQNRYISLLSDYFGFELCQEFGLRFSTNTYIGRIESSLAHFEWIVDPVIPYDTFITHPWVEVMTPECARIYNSVSEDFDGITLICSITLDRTIPPEDRDTLRDIGKIQTIVTEPATSEVLLCN